MVMWYPKLSLVILLLFPTCVSCGRCYYSATRAQRYTERCGWWNRRRCAKYRTERYTASKCCDGWTGSNCNSRIPKGPNSATLKPTTARESVTEGSNMRTITCSCGTCIPSCAIRWSRNGATVGTSGRLQINNVQRGSAGRYTCTCKNSQTSTSKSISFTLSVRYGPDDTILSPVNTAYTFQEGFSLAPVTCNCKNCNPNCNVKWTFADIDVTSSRILELKNISRDSAGQYTCTCRNPSSAKVVKKSLDVTVLYGPDSVTLSPPNSTYQIQEGISVGPITCDCGKCEPSCDTRWTFNDTSIADIDASDELELPAVTRNSTGRFACVCTNPSSQKEQRQQFYLIVRYGPDELTLTPGNTSYTIQEGSSFGPVTCTCGSCEPQCTVRWTFNETGFADNGTSDVLEITSVYRNLSGQFSCLCTNPASSKEEAQYFDLAVQYGPDDIIVSPDNRTFIIQEGSSLEPITCSCGKCEPSCIVQWTYLETSSGDHILELINVSRHETGQFSCTCRNPATSKERIWHFNLTVQYGPDEVMLFPSNATYARQEGTSLGPITCDCGKCKPTCSAYWKFNGMSVPDSGTSEVLQLNTIDRNSTGIFTCVCTNPANLKEETQHFSLSIQYGPDDISISPSNTTFIVQEGSSMEPVTCSCGKCQPSCMTEWSYLDTVLSYNAVLKLESVSRNTTGQISCACTNPSTSNERKQHFNLTVQYGPDEVHLFPANATYTIEEGLSLGIVTCTCGKCEPTCSIYWTFNGMVVFDDGMSEALELRAVYRNTTGIYKCVCTNPANSKTRTHHFSLSVQYGPDDISISPNNTTFIVQEGSSMKPVTCSCGKCEPSCMSKWSYLDTVLSYNAVLKLESVSRNTTGQIVCTCKNPSTSKERKQHFNLTVQYGPDAVLLSPANASYAIQEGLSLGIVNCTCGKCEPTCSIYWTFNGMVVFDGGMSDILELKAVYRNTTGIFTCVCTNPANSKTGTQHFSLSVQYGPDEVRITPSTTTYTMHERSTFGPVICSCGKCEPKCNALWAFNELPVKDSGESDVLEITSLFRNSTGHYTCLCTNPATSHQETASFNLTVHYGPDDIMISPGHTSYTIEEGDSLEPVTCSCLKCHPSCLAKWTFQDILISNSSILKLSNLSRNAAGPYFCVCTHPFTSKEEQQQIYIRVQYGPDQVVLLPANKTYMIQEGSAFGPVKCSCGTCEPECGAIWTFNERSLNNVGILELNVINRNLTGQFTCICQNPETKREATEDINLIIYYGPDEVLLSTDNKSLTIQESLSWEPVTCNCTNCEPICEIKWVFHNSIVSYNGSLDLKHISRNMTGPYYCICTNPASTKEEIQQLNLTVFYGPDQVSLSPVNKTYMIQEGSVFGPVKCSCGTCEPECGAIWLFNEKNLNDLGILELNVVNRNLTGQFTCICKNPETKREATEDINLIIYYGPDEVLLSTDNRSLTIQESSAWEPITCYCTNCEPICKAKWVFRNGIVSHNGSLDLIHVSRNMTGLYYCICTNPASAKEETQQLNLTVFYGPNAVTLSPADTTYFIQEGSSLVPVYCHCGECKPICSVHWMINDINVADNRVSSALQLDVVNRNSSGLYKCSCINPASLKEETQLLNLTVQFGPDNAMVTPRKKIFTVKEGSTLANITCTCGDCEPKCISDWSSNGVTIGTDVLRLNSVSKSNIGNYTCTCTNPSTLKQARSEQRIEVEYGPDHARLTPENTSIVLQEGSDDFEVVCSCGECVPTCDQYWSFEGETIVQNQSVYFYKTFRTHAGEYRCTCSNPSTSKEETSHFFLSILFGPDNAFLAPTNRTITVHESSSMRNVTCICGDCEPKCEAQWLFNGNRSGYASLELNNVSRFDAGIYKCACMNPTTLKEANTDIEIVVEYGPDQVSLTPNKRNYQLQEGTVTLDILCSCGDCLPNCSQYWFFDGNKLAIVHNLHVNNVTRNHTGQYTCICVNPTTSREEESHFIVNVHYGPDLAFVNPYMTTFNKTVGSHLRNITCTCIDCEPKCTAAWRLNGTERSRNDVIYINRLSKSDAGRYTCICSNPSTLKTIESKHFDLIVNAIENTQPCPQNADEWGTMWETTYAGHLVSIDCKGEDYRGRISRLCSKTGEWLMPQYNCVRSTFVEVEKKLEILTINSSNDEVGDALDALVNLTNTNDEGDELYSGELKSVMRILGIIANLAAGGMPITEQQSKVFMNVVDNVLNKAGRRSWKSLSQTEESDGGSKLLLSVDVLSESLSNGLEDTNRSVITISLPNIVLETRKIDINQRKIKFPLPSMAKNLDTAMGTKLSLPLQNSTASNIRRYTVAVYKNLAGVLPNTVATRNDTENDRSQSLNTPVVSLHVFPYQQKLEKPLRLVLKHQQTHFRNPKCVYWSIQRNRWETDGCRVVTSTRSETTCECYHLTNLAVLMSPWSEPTVDSMAIGIISIVGCSISIICLIATATVHFLLWSNLNNDRAISLINICVALTVTYILFLAGIHQTGDKDGCIAVSVLLHYTTLVVFCLMLAEGIELTKTVFATKSGIKWMIPLAWGVPAAIVGLSMAITQLEGYGTQTFCWFSLKSGVIWAFVGPALFLIVANAVCLAVLLRTMLKIKAYKDMSEGDRIKSSVRCLCVLVPLMGCTWLLGVFYVNERSAWMQYLFALCISLQGLFIFLFHGLLNKQLHNAIRRRHQKYTDSDSLTETQDTGQTEFQCTMNPVYSSDVPIQSPSKPNPILKYGRKLSVQLTKTGSYSPMQESDE